MNGEYEHITAGIPVVNPKYQPLGTSGLKLECSASITDLLRDAYQSSQGRARTLSRFWVNFMSCVGGTRKLAPTCGNCKHFHWRAYSKTSIPRYHTRHGLWYCRKLGFIGWDPLFSGCVCEGKQFRRRPKNARKG